MQQNLWFHHVKKAQVIVILEMKKENIKNNLELLVIQSRIEQKHFTSHQGFP